MGDQPNEDRTIEWDSQPTATRVTPQPGSSARDKLLASQPSIGAYRILGLLGEGGMGTVYRAEQQNPHRIVALKVMKLGFVNPEHLRRFEHEADALGRLQHPGIAQIYEAGTADSGSGPQPYFAMELIQGLPLIDYAKQRNLHLRGRLELMARICDAVSHAHQRGIIHRDLKPSNILVDELGQPKILDFGIARVTDSDTMATRQTDVGQLIGTLAYMSPEQVLANPQALDTRSDVYALGVNLYELLAGKPPYKTEQKALHEVVRVIREEDPARLSSVNRHFRGDVETIVAKALEKDKARRYASAAELAQDIRRYLTDEPIVARPPSTTYQLQKFARRHKAVVAGTVAVFITLIIGVVVSTREAVLARRAERAAKADRDRADAEAATSKAVIDFLQNGLLSQASVNQQSGVNSAPDPNVTVRTLLDRAAATIGEKFKNQPLVEAGVRSTIGMTYRDLNLREQADEQLQKAYDLSLKNRGADDPDTLEALEGVASMLWDEGKAAEAAKLEKSALDGMLRVLGPEDRRTLRAMQNLGTFYIATHRYDDAEPLAKKALEIQIRTLGYDDQDTLDTSDTLATVYRFKKEYALADPLFAKGLESYRRVFGPTHPFTLREMYGLAVNDVGEGKYAEAEKLLQQVVEGNAKLLGENHPSTLATKSALANDYERQGKLHEAASLETTVVDAYTHALGPIHPYTLSNCVQLARIYRELGQYTKAEKLLSDRTEQALRTKDGVTTNVLDMMFFLAETYRAEKEFAQSAAEMNRLIQLDQRVVGPDDARTLGDMLSLGKDYLTLKKFAQAEPLFQRAVAQNEKKDPERWQRFYAQNSLGAALAGKKKYAEAEPMLVSGFEGMKQREDKIPPDAKEFLPEAGERVMALYQSWGKPDKVAEWKAKLAAEQKPAAAPPKQ